MAVGTLIQAVVMAATVALLATSAACSERDEKSAPGATATNGAVGGGPALVPAPPAQLKDSSGHQVEATPGSRCWYSVCVDVIGFVTPSAPTRVKTGEGLSVEFGAGRPTSVEYTWMSGPTASAPVPGGLVGWQPEPANMQKAAPPLKAPQTRGEYLLIAFGRWNGRGDITYAWYLKVD